MQRRKRDPRDWKNITRAGRAGGGEEGLGAGTIRGLPPHRIRMDERNIFSLRAGNNYVVEHAKRYPPFLRAITRKESLIGFRRASEQTRPTVSIWKVEGSPARHSARYTGTISTSTPPRAKLNSLYVERDASRENVSARVPIFLSVCSVAHFQTAVVHTESPSGFMHFFLLLQSHEQSGRDWG